MGRENEDGGGEMRTRREREEKGKEDKNGRAHGGFEGGQRADSEGGDCQGDEGSIKGRGIVRGTQREDR